MPVSAAHLRRLADEIEQEELAAKRELEDAETSTERKEIRDKIAQLEERAERAERLLREREGEGGDDPADGAGQPAAGSPSRELKPKRKKTRPGRKQGMVYKNPETGLGEVYQGEDEPDLVEEDDDEDEE